MVFSGSACLLGRVEARGRFSEVNHDVLLLGVVLQDDLVGLTADAGLLVAAEGGAGRDHVVGVDPHTAGLHGAGHPDRAVNVPCPDSAAQASFHCPLMNS